MGNLGRLSICDYDYVQPTSIDLIHGHYESIFLKFIQWEERTDLTISDKFEISLFIAGDQSGKLRNFNLLLMADILPSYPPSLPPKALHFLLTSLTDYCLSHGVTVRPAQPSEGNHLASHAPVTLFPSLFPRTAWEQAIQVQTTYNILYAKIANDEEWLGKIMDEWAPPEKCLIVDLWK
jgi:hypothetical protein